MRRIPIITVVAVGVALVAAVVQYTVPSAVSVLQREPTALRAGQWWRLVTPLFVQTLGWYQVVTNLVTLVLVGTVAERHLGRWRWTVLFVAGTVAGQLAAYIWHEPGGGDSIAICGLAGGLVVWFMTDRGNVNRWATGAVVCYIAALTGWGLGGIKAAAAAVILAVLVLFFARARRGALLGAASCALVLATVADLHGVSLLSGMLTALVFTLAAKRQREQPTTPAGQTDAPSCSTT